MIMTIISTTDGRYLGKEIDVSQKPIKLSDDVFFYADKSVEIPEGLRIFNSNYVVDVKR